jgi:hypothetical protein
MDKPIVAGRELDALVAEKVMGWNFQRSAFSTDIASAWEVVEKLQALEYTFINLLWDGQGWDIEMGQDGHDISCDTYADTFPLAICLAALKAVDAIPS